MSDETLKNRTTDTADAGACCDLGDQDSVCTLMASTFRGKLAWMSILVCVYMLVFMAIAVVSAVLFFRAETTRGMILAATVFIVTTGMISTMKLWSWNMMWRNSILARIDRLEKRLARPDSRQHM